MTSAPEHLLIVDDDPDIRQLLADYLRENGYRVTAAADDYAPAPSIEFANLSFKSGAGMVGLRR